ncbi:hypothetical protein ACIOJ9_39785 [Streptomyces sp. NPDC088175]|uniref:hypothetical protein n=1 Tax=unclassified Streptomyces TaxID=2593676 RepID=UPI00380DF211
MTARVPAAVTPTTLSPVLLLLDAGDDHAIHHAAHQRARPERGCITADPTPHTNSLAYLALDLLRAMGRDSFTRPDAERMSTDAAWRAVTCWTLTTGLKQAIVLRAHRLTLERLARLATWRAWPPGAPRPASASSSSPTPPPRPPSTACGHALPPPASPIHTPSPAPPPSWTPSARPIQADATARPRPITSLRCPTCPMATPPPSSRSADAT